MNLCDSAFWEKQHGRVDFALAREDNVVRQWIESRVPQGSGSCLEVGCFPGTYLAVFGELGYRLSGIDIVSGVVDDLPTWFASRGYALGDFRRGDFTAEDCFPDESFDIVCSFGFLEHFSNWPEILLRHGRYVKPGGLLLVSAPNFRGMGQRVLHALLDRDNLAHHNLEAMRPRQWGAVLRNAGFDVDFEGYFGRFNFWVAHPAGLDVCRKLAYRGIRALRPVLRKLPVIGFYAPFLGVVARKGSR